MIEVLPKEDADRLRELYLAKFYHQVYPDSMYPGPIRQRFLELPDLSEDVVTAANELWNSYLRNYERFNLIMRDETDRWDLQVASTRNLNGRKSHDEVMSNALLGRIEASELFIKQLFDLVPMSQEHISIAEMLADWRVVTRRVKDRASPGSGMAKRN